MKNYIIPGILIAGLIVLFGWAVAVETAKAQEQSGVPSSEGACVTSKDIQEANKVDKSAVFADLKPEDQVKNIVLFFTAKGAHIDPTVNEILVGRTDAAPDVVFIWGFKADGCIDGKATLSVEDFKKAVTEGGPSA